METGRWIEPDRLGDKRYETKAHSRLEFTPCRHGVT